MKNRFDSEKTSFFFVIILVFLANSVYAQKVGIDSRLDTNEILIGDQIYLHLDVVQDKEVNIQDFDVKDKLPDKIEVIEAENPDTTFLEEDDRYRITQKYLITSFDSGKVHIPELAFQYKVGDELDTIKSLPMDLMVQTVTIDTTKTIFDIKEPFGAPVSFREILPYLLVFLTLVVIAFLVWYYLRYMRNKKTKEEPKKPLEPAHVIALRELDKLKEERLWQQDKIKLYYTKLVDILRYYLWLRYDIKTLERTTDEILLSLHNTGFDDEKLYKMLAGILRQGDLVKFAKWIPSPEENEQYLNDAYEFVTQTKLEKPESEEKDENHEEGEALNKKQEE
ncbi:MAG: hypothetical protein R6U04_03085 [Bacteroidales bacterium]